MAVYERTYRAYAGALTASWSRFLVPARYAFADVFRSRLFLAFFVVCLLWPIVCSLVIYLRHNVDALEMLAAMGIEIDDWFRIDAAMVRNWYMRPQGWLAFVVALIVGPVLVSPDLRNNAMCLYLSRPFTRLEYVGGKLTVLAALLSAITWIPGMLLLALNGVLEGGSWMMDNLWIALSVFIASWVWILLLGLLALALSAWVKWKPLARLLFLGLFMVLAGFGGLLRVLYKTEWATLMDLWTVRNGIWDGLFGMQVASGLPLAAAWLAWIAALAVSAFLLSRRIRAYEVAS